MYSRIPKLPNEIVDAILEILKEEMKFKTLASVARVNHTMYDIAVPKIYETVVFKGTSEQGMNNHAMIAYGHSPSALHSGRRKHDGHELIVDNQANNIPTRKDIATSHTRKLVIGQVPELGIPRSYLTVNAVKFAARCLLPYKYHGGYRKLIATEWMERQLQKVLRAITSSNSSADSLHITVYDEQSHRAPWEILGRLLMHFESAIPCTFEFFDFDLFHNHGSGTALHTAYELQAVVHIGPEAAFLPAPPSGLLALSIDNLFEDEDMETPVGQFFLCGLPRAILTPTEFASAHDTNEAALIKLCRRITVWPNLSGSQYETKLDFLKSRIKLVEPGFRPSMADLYPKPQAT